SVPAHGEDRTGDRRGPLHVHSRLVQGAGSRQMRTALLVFAVVTVGAHGVRAQNIQVGQTLPLVHPEGPTAAPRVITLQDAIERARQNDPQFQASAAEAEIAREDRVQAKASLLPTFSNSTQFLGNSANGVNPNGRFVSLDGVQMYREWLVLRQEVSASTFMRTPLQRAHAAELAAEASRPAAGRALLVTGTPR